MTENFDDPTESNGPTESGGPHENDDTIQVPGARGDIPERIGKYVIRRLIASGGMGTVYEAMQEQPRRPVAIKVMRPGMFSEEALRRFEYEAQMLARLRHPGVAQVYEAGTHREGGKEIPFFAMEYIPNAKPITEFARTRGLTTRERLELFVQVCDAVHHGHQRGIIHRDLKPGNILVDSSGHPKIIDFGVARATDSDMVAAAHQTEVGQIIGSLQYMSPEQFDADPSDIDTRSDVYALGVVLYELLSGQLPYDISGSRIHEAAAMVRDVEPPALGRIDKSLRGDIETIVGCALSKDRDRRYQSAFGLREDIRRYLSGAAIGMRPPTLKYQLRVLARRNKPWIAAAAVMLFVLVAGGALSTYMYFKAESARADSEQHAARSQAALEFLGDMMRQTGPHGWGHEPKMSDLVTALRERVDVVFRDEPEVAADIHSAIAWALLPMEDLEGFEKHCTAAAALRLESLGPTDPSTIRAMRDVARAQEIRGRNEQLVQTRRELLDMCTERYGPQSFEALSAGDELASAYELVGEYREARKIASGVLERFDATLGEVHGATIASMAHVANLYLKTNDRQQALSMAQHAYDIVITELSGEKDLVEYTRSALASCFISYGRLDDAAVLYDQKMPRDPGLIKAYQGSQEIGEAGLQLLVMWETWCPFSQRIIPIAEELYRRHEEAGLGVTGLTRVTRSSSDARVEAFIDDQHVSFPMLKDSGKTWSYFQAHGTPYVVLLVDGRVVWKGSVDTAADLSDTLVGQLMKAYESGRM